LKSTALLDSMKESEKEFKYALRACQKSKEKQNSDAMPRCLRDNSDLPKKSAIPS